MPDWTMRNALDVRDQITAAQMKRIQDIYKDAAKHIDKELIKYQNMDTTTGRVKTLQLSVLQAQLKEQMNVVAMQIEESVKWSMYEMSASVAKEAEKFAIDAGLSGIRGLYSKVPHDVVASISSGMVYNTTTPLSSRIWAGVDKNLDDIQSIVAKGVAENKSVYAIAKDLEKYVDPSAKKDWEWSKVYPGTNKHVDYNAQRLARTMVQHAYQQSFVRVTQDNPFIERYRWCSAFSARTCPLCADMDGKLFDKGELPYDHPNGLCTVAAEIEKSAMQISNEIADWYEAPEGTYPEIDRYAKSMGYRMTDLKNEKVKMITPASVANMMRDVPLEKLEKMLLADGYQDEVGKILSERLGYGALPQMVDEFSAGSTPIARGVCGRKAAEYVEQFKTGDYFFGRGIYGNGAYFGYGDQAKDIALEYANGNANGVIEAALSPKAKVISYEDIMNNYYDEYMDKLGKYSDNDQIMFSDVGKWAMCNGYDAIKMEEQDYMVVLNRAMVEVKR